MGRFFIFRFLLEFAPKFSGYFPFDTFCSKMQKGFKCFYALILAKLCAKAINRVLEWYFSLSPCHAQRI